MPLDQARCVTQHGDRYYETPAGRFPSVTTILGATKSEEDKAGLDWWGRVVTATALYLRDGVRPDEAALCREIPDEERGRTIWAGRLFESAGRYRVDGTEPAADSAMRGVWDQIVMHIEDGAEPDSLPDLIRDAGGFRGKMLHDAIEAWLIDDAVPAANDPVRPYWDSLHTIRVDLAPFLPAYAIEVPVWHPELRYAGTIDLGASIRTYDCVLDWKTADKPKRREHCRDYELQVAAYVVASQRCLKLPRGVVLDSAMVAIAIPGKAAQEIAMKPRDILDAFEEFEERCDRFWAEVAT